ncbi:MAG TPA: peptidoglycan-binding domain-containing protein [Alphaproteobacteria bacterium]|nr:peptidoglycan-binding domain-containing protein [Alphaproteobacteria bacterium]
MTLPMVAIERIYCGPARKLGGACLVVVLLLQACGSLSQSGPAPPTPAAKPVVSVASQLETAAGSVDIRSVQLALFELGYYEAGVDGIAGPKTKAAIRAFQKDSDLQITGDLTHELVQTIVDSAAGARRRLSSYSGLVQPVYEAGDRFYYSNGISETVLALESGRVVWESSDGTRRTAPWNFVLPPFAWFGEHGSGSAEAEAPFDLLWPLKPGTEARFSISATRMVSSTRPEDIFELWHCKVRSPVRVTVPAGTFDTLPIICDAFRQPSGPKRMMGWNYAPAVGHFVRRMERTGEEKVESVELVAVELGGRDWPAAARAGLGWALQHTLENESLGGRVNWESSALPGHIEIEALAETDFNGAEPCRRFAATRFDAEGMKRVYPGIACRASDGTWSVPHGPDRARAELP